LKKKHRQLQK